MKDFIELKQLFIQTEEVLYPCPKCGTYSKPRFIDKKGYAYMLCPECKTQYKTSTAVSINFRKFCSKIASQPNRSQTHYTSLERKVKKVLDEFKYKEGIDYIHNAAVRNGKHIYYLDFYIPRENKVIECNGSVWHQLWNREESDKRKIEYLKEHGLTIIIVTEKEAKNERELKEYLARRLEWSCL